MDFRMVSGASREKVCSYIARYISRDLRKREKSAKGVRMITASGNLRCPVKWWVRISDLRVEQTFTSLAKSLRAVCEDMGMRLSMLCNPQNLFTLAPPEALEKWRNLNPGLAF
jgi:hypothetical protein